ncbi:MAG TPA: hypothetical protein VH985_12085, partial [Candidatus Binatia bacterium]
MAEKYLSAAPLGTAQVSTRCRKLDNKRLRSKLSKTHHANDSHSVTPECFSPGSRIRIGLDSRLKHAGMTDFGLAVAKT